MYMHVTYLRIVILQCEGLNKTIQCTSEHVFKIVGQILSVFINF